MYLRRRARVARAVVAGGAVTFTGTFSDLTETGAAGTVGLAQVVYDADNTGTWKALSLTRDPANGLWSAGASLKRIIISTLAPTVFL